MAGLAEKMIELLLPKGLIWNTGKGIKALNRATAKVLDEVKVVIEDVQKETIPKTVKSTIPQWFKLFNIRRDRDGVLAQERARLDAIHTSIGGVSLDYVNGQIKRSFSRVDIEEVSETEYEVRGAVGTVRDLVKLNDLLTRTVSLHLSPTINLRVDETLDVAHSGIALTGKAICGKPLII